MKALRAFGKALIIAPALVLLAAGVFLVLIAPFIVAFVLDFDIGSPWLIFAQVLWIAVWVAFPHYYEW
jgi:hypothetical protein